MGWGSEERERERKRERDEHGKIKSEWTTYKIEMIEEGTGMRKIVENQRGKGR